VNEFLEDWRLEQSLVLMQAFNEWGERKRAERAEREQVWDEYRRRHVARTRKTKRPEPS
jgi:hypothetical protein